MPQVQATREREREREREVPHPNTAPFLLCPLRPTNTATFSLCLLRLQALPIFAILAKPNLSCIVCTAKFAVFCWICCAVLALINSLCWILLSCRWNLPRCAVSLPNSPRCAVLCFAEFAMLCHAPLRPKNAPCHATPRAKFSPHAQGASTATLKGVVLRWHKAFAKVAKFTAFAFKGSSFFKFMNFYHILIFFTNNKKLKF